MTRIPFIKMEGIGNDYVYLDLFPGRGLSLEQLGDLPGLARRMSDRHFGIGSDGLILIHPSKQADARMQMFNADGSEGEMCGNGIRCVARYLVDEGLVAGPELRVETGAGMRTLTLVPMGDESPAVRVDMGFPRLERSEVPMIGPPGRVVEEPITVEGTELRITAVSMGNPHAVIFVDDVEAVPVERLGPRLEAHALFPRRTNVEFVQVLSRSEVRQRTWERGSGETLACGTGASAVCVAGVLAGKTDRRILDHLRGGALVLEWVADGAVFMQGPAREVFRGIWVFP